MPVDEILFSAEEHMDKAIEHLRHELRGLRTGRASTSLVEFIKVDYYGAMSDLRSLASLTTPDATSILIKPFDPASMKDILKAIDAAKLGISPQNDGKQIRLILPPLSGERRQQLVTKAKEAGEHCRISLRNNRRDANKQVDGAEKNGELSEDQAKSARDQVQDLLKTYEAKVDDILAAKQKEITEV
jgi:ribosome recycling factor